MPPEVAEWLGSQARPLLAAGRLLVVPAVQVGCTQKDVGWTDDVLLSRFLRGVVVATGGAQLSEAPVLDLAQVALPYMGGPGLSIADLAKAIEDLGESMRPYRRRMLGILGSQGSAPLSWAQGKSIRLEIEEGIEEVRRHFSHSQAHQCQAHGIASGHRCSRTRSPYGAYLDVRSSSRNGWASDDAACVAAAVAIQGAWRQVQSGGPIDRR